MASPVSNKAQPQSKKIPLFAPLDSKAKQKVLAYRDDYRRPDRSDRPKAFLPAIMATRGRIQGELLRLLFIISHRQAEDYFARLGDDPSNAAFTTRRAIYHTHNRACIGLPCAQAVASRAYLPSLPLQRLPPPPPSNVAPFPPHPKVISTSFLSLLPLRRTLSALPLRSVFALRSC